MPVNTLRRYKRHYKLQTRPGLNKAQLADVSMTFLLPQRKRRKLSVWYRHVLQLFYLFVPLFLAKWETRAFQTIIFSLLWYSLADPGGGTLGAWFPHTDQSFLNFMGFFWGGWGKNMGLASLFKGWDPLVRKSWIRHCWCDQTILCQLPRKLVTATE